MTGNHNHNNNPENILNYTWNITRSEKLDGSTIDPNDSAFLQESDLIKFSRNANSGNPKDLVFLVVDHANQQLYELEAQLIYSKQSLNSDSRLICEEAVVRFNDDVGTTPKDRVIVLRAVRFEGKFNSSEQSCITRIQQVGQFIDQSEHANYCNADSKNLLIWKICEWEDWISGTLNSGSSNQVAPLGKPEPGQGTASGGPD